MAFDVNKHIIFEEIEMPLLSTKVWRVLNALENCRIGTVAWYPAWRHYCFAPVENSVFSDRCMLKIGEFVEKQNKAHRRG